MNRRTVILILVSWLLWVACDKPEPLPNSVGQYSAGVFAINEGMFGNTSGTITHFDREHNTTTQRIFGQKNQRDLGDVVQSLVFEADKGYIVVNNSNKIEVVDAATFEEKAQITGLRLPRYCLPISSTEAYVTEWGVDGLTGSLARIDLVTNTVLERIPVEQGPERLLLKNGLLYLTHIGGFGTNNKVTVFDVQQRQVVRVITVADKPSGIVEDQQGMLWVACAGAVNYLTYPNIDTANSTESKLLAIDPVTNLIAQEINFGKGNPIGNLIINSRSNEQLFYTKAGQVWSYNIATATEEALFTGNYYGLGYDPTTQYLYAATSSGIDPAEVQRFRVDGTPVDTYTAGVFANGFVFK
ncbi:MAG: YncE family protein [Aureispira sp.]